MVSSQLAIMATNQDWDESDCSDDEGQENLSEAADPLSRAQVCESKHSYFTYLTY